MSPVLWAIPLGIIGLILGGLLFLHVRKLGEQRFPKGYLRQLVYPFRNDPKTAEVVDPSGR